MFSIASIVVYHYRSKLSIDSVICDTSKPLFSSFVFLFVVHYASVDGAIGYKEADVECY